VIVETGAVITVTTLVVIQPVANVYVIVVVPLATPVTAPVPDNTVAIAVLLLAQVPPPDVLVSVMVETGHTDDGPPMAAGSGLTVNERVRKQPLPIV
jgi:hypothetical protein